MSRCLKDFPTGSSGGFSGLMADHLKGPDCSGFQNVLAHLARICSDFAWGRFDAPTAAALSGARLIPLGKAGGGVRPIAVGELIRRLAGKLLVARYQKEITGTLPPLQYGVGVRGGAECLIHHARNWLHTAPPDHGLLQLDFRNAYNSLNRNHMLSAIAHHCPILSHYATACYGNPATLFASGFTIESQEGQHQGCPLGPLFFAISVIHLTKLAQNVPLVWTKWYLDDGYLGGPLPALDGLLPQIEQAAAQVGLSLNKSKCALLLASSHDSPLWLPGIPRVPPTECMVVLGSPVGPLDACKT